MTLPPGKTRRSRPAGERMGSAGRELLGQDAATSSTSVSVGRRASWSAAWWRTDTGAVNGQQTDDADRLAAAAEDFLVYP